MQHPHSSIPFNPETYTASGTFAALQAGMEETLRRWDEIPVGVALVLPAFYMEGRDRGAEHQVPMFMPRSMSTIERERLAVSNACAAVLKRARDDGYDAGAIVQELCLALRPTILTGIERFKALNAPKPSLLSRLFGQ